MKMTTPTTIFSCGLPVHNPKLEKNNPDSVGAFLLATKNNLVLFTAYQQTYTASFLNKIKQLPGFYTQVAALITTTTKKV
jgi:hypothetical protein